MSSKRIHLNMKNETGIICFFKRTNMQQLKILFPMNTNIDNQLNGMFKHFLNDIDSNIENYKGKKTVDDVKEKFKSSFESLKLSIEFDNEYTPNTILEKQPNPYSRNGYHTFEIRDYRFKVTGNTEMMFIHSGGGIPMNNPPTGYVQNQKHLYIRVMYNQNLSYEEKEQTIFEQIKRQKEVINQCIVDQTKKIDDFIAKNIQVIETKFKDILTKHDEKANFETSLKNKLSEL